MAEKHIQNLRLSVVALILLASSVIYVLLPIQALRWAQTPFAGFLLDPNLVVSDTGKSAWLAQLEPPLGYPQRLVALDGAPLESNAAFYALLATKAIGDEVRLTFEQPHNSRLAPDDGQVGQREITAVLTPFTSQQLGQQFWLRYLVGLIILVIGIWVFLARPQLEAAQLFAAFAVAGSLATGLLFDLVTTQSFIRIWLVALSFAISLNVVVALTFPHETRFTKQYPYFKWLLFLPATIICLWGQVWLFWQDDPWAYVIPWRMAYLFNGLALLLVWGIMARRGFASRSSFVRQQGRFVLVSAFLGFAPILIFFLTASRGIRLSWLVAEVYLPPVVLYPLTTGYLIIRQRLMDMNEAMRRGLAYALLLGLLFGAVILIVTGLGTMFDTRSPFFLALLILLVTVIFTPLRNGLQRELDRLMFRQPAWLSELLREYSRELKTAVTSSQVQELLLKYASQGLPDSSPQLFLPNSETRYYTNGNGTLIEMDSPLVQAIRLQSGVLDLFEERIWPEELRPHRQAIWQMNAAVLVPMTTEQNLLGWLTLSPKGNRQSFAHSELVYLEDLADQSLVGLERAYVIGRLESRVGELDTLNQFSQLLNFTPDSDAVLGLVYAHFQQLFAVQNFYVSQWDQKAGQLYMAFCQENGRRQEEREGRHQLVEYPLLYEALETGQTVVNWQDNCFWIVTPLNAGAQTLGTIHAIYADRTLSRRQIELFEVFADRTAVALERLQTQAQLESRAQKLETINQIALSLASTIRVEPLLNLILDKAIELLTAEAGTFLLVDEDSGELEFSVVRGPSSAELLGTRLPVGKGLAGAVARTGQPILTNEARKDKRHFTAVDKATEFVTHSMLTVPLALPSNVLGVLQIINKQDGELFDESDQNLLMGFAAQAVVALQNARLLAQTDEALQARVDELFRLQQLDRELNTTLNPNEVLAITLDWSLRICHGTAGAIILADEEGAPTMRAVRGYDRNEMMAPIGLGSTRMGLIGQVLASGKPHVTGMVEAEPEYVAASSYTRSQLTLPIIHQQKTLGAMAIESDEADAFDEGVVETAVRVTNHAAAAIANALLYAQVNEANQAKSEFVSMVSHELKTPMTSMRGYTDLLLSGMMGDLTEQQRKFLEIIAQNIQRMNRQVQDLTDISRIESGRLHMSLGPTSFASVVSETLTSVQGIADEKGTKLNLNIPVKLPLVHGDKERLVQVLTNLISNAIKYSPANTEVLVRFETAEFVPSHPKTAQAMVVCSVQDQGYGISADDQQKLFTKFFRADDPNIRQAKGTGLGLSITKGIVELHGGQIWLQSDLGQGTTFFFAIPQSVEV